MLKSLQFLFGWGRLAVVFKRERENFREPEEQGDPQESDPDITPLPDVSVAHV